MPLWLHRIIVKLMARPFAWANHHDPQNWLTRKIRAIWRAL